MAFDNLFHLLNHSAPKPDFLETFVVACSVLAYLVYLVYIIRTGNSKILSFSTLIVTAGAALIFAIREFVSGRRWLILIQYILLVLITFYIGIHRWSIMF